MKMIIDGHCDSIQRAFDEKKNINDKELQFTFEKAKKFSSYIQMLAVFVNPTYTRKENGGFIRANSIIDKFYSEKGNIILVENENDLNNVINKQKYGAILTIENGSAISSNLDNIWKLKQRGVKVMSITWNSDNELGCGALNKENDTGLTNLGKEYVKKLVKENILVDVSHSSLKTFYDVMDISNDNVVATHSCVYKICNHLRNLRDEQIKLISQKNGIIGICFCKEFLSKKKANVLDIVKHIDYVVNLVGIDYVGIGSDFDGINKNDLPEGIKDVTNIDLIERELYKIGYKENDVDKIMGENWIRVLNNIMKEEQIEKT